jgi:hypothetical protein
LGNDPILLGNYFQVTTQPKIQRFATNQIMNNQPYSVTAETVTTSYPCCSLPSLCWGAIIGGTIAAIAIQILMSVLGAGAGLSAFAPLTDSEPAKHFSEGAAAVWAVSALVALFFGSVIAGRFSTSLHSGFVHGIMVWSVTLIITLVLVSEGAGVIMGSAFKVLGIGLEAGGKTVASGVAEVVKSGAKRSEDQVKSFVTEATDAMPTNTSPMAKTRALRQVGFAVTKMFASSNNVMSEVNRTAAVKAITDNTQLSQNDANKMVDEWTASYKDLQTDLTDIKTAAEQKAREAADQAADALSSAGIWSFFALLIGLIVSGGGGVLGADFALKRIKQIQTVRTTQIPVS